MVMIALIKLLFFAVVRAHAPVIITIKTVKSKYSSIVHLCGRFIARCLTPFDLIVVDKEFRETLTSEDEGSASVTFMRQGLF